MTIPRREILRYLGCAEETPSPALVRAIGRAEQTLSEIARPKSVWKKLPRAAISWDGSTVCKALSGCNEAVLFALTLGSEVDRRLSRAAREDMSDAVVLQAAATALVEELCDALQAEAAQELGLFSRPRISPGYGDFDISAQREITRILDTPRQIGLTLTDGLMLAPTKSVTALFGLSDKERTRCAPSCTSCEKQDCAYRRRQQG